MDGFFETSSFWQGGFTEEQKYYYKEHRLSQKGKHLWEQIDKLNTIAREVCSTYNVTYCFDKYCCCRRYKHLLFNVSIMIMLPYLLMLKEIMIFMMWNKLKNLLLSRVHLNLPVC